MCNQGFSQPYLCCSTAIFIKSSGSRWSNAGQAQTPKFDSENSNDSANRNQFTKQKSCQNQNQKLGLLNILFPGNQQKDKKVVLSICSAKQTGGFGCGFDFVGWRHHGFNLVEG
jgi:hypothetical protein